MPRDHRRDRDRDSPIEQTGAAHIVETGCACCATTLRVPESAAACGVWCVICRVALPELAYVERSIRDSDAVRVDVSIAGHGARIRFETPASDRHYRGRLVANCCTAIGETHWWRVSAVHDPLGRAGSPLVESMLRLTRVDRSSDETEDSDESDQPTDGP